MCMTEVSAEMQISQEEQAMLAALASERSDYRDAIVEDMHTACLEGETEGVADVLECLADRSPSRAFDLSLSLLSHMRSEGIEPAYAQPLLAVSNRILWEDAQAQTSIFTESDYLNRLSLEIHFWTGGTTEELEIDPMGEFSALIGDYMSEFRANRTISTAARLSDWDEVFDLLDKPGRDDTEQMLFDLYHDAAVMRRMQTLRTVEARIAAYEAHPARTVQGQAALRQLYVEAFEEYASVYVPAQREYRKSPQALHDQYIANSNPWRDL